MSAFVLKIIAVITMFIDHIGYVVYNGNTSYFNYIGRIAFPIFAFQISEGYMHTKNLKKYFLKLFLFALISQIPFMLFQFMISVDFGLNVLFTLLLGLLAIFIYDKSKYKSLGILAAIGIGLVSQFSHCDYGFYGVAVIFIFYVFKNNFINASIFFTLATAIKYTYYMIKFNAFMHPKLIYAFLCTCIPLFFIAAYNGKKGKNTKYLLYIFYPIHLLIIYEINLIFNL